jgi:hypothetical protein
MKNIVAAAVASLLVAGSAFAAPTTGEYGNHCAWGLTMGKQVATDCKINWTDSTSHKTYCFSTDEAKGNWAKDTTANTKKADAEFSKVKGTDHAHAKS